MNRKWLWLVLVAVAVAGFVVGVVVAQEEEEKELEYPYLWEEYSETFYPTFADWQEIEMMARLNNEGPLTDRLVRTGLEVWAHSFGFFADVSTKTQPDWDVHLGKGRFDCSDRQIRAAYQEAAEVVMEDISGFFLGISEDDVEIDFFIDGSFVGTWKNGQMMLEGEQVPE